MKTFYSPIDKSEKKTIKIIIPTHEQKILLVNYARINK